MNDTLSQRIEESCAAFADRPFSVDGAGTVLTFGQLFLTLLAFSERLSARGIGEGQRVALAVDDMVLSMLLRLALLRLGATVLPGTRAVLLARHGVAVDWGLRPGTEDLGPGEIGVDAAWFAPPHRALPVSGKGRIVRTTSGTTGTPKLRVVDEAGLLARVEHGLRERGAPEGPAYIGYAAGSNPGFNMFCRVLVSGQLQLYQQATPTHSLAQMARFGAVVAYLPPGAYFGLCEARESGAPRPERLAALQVGGGGLSPAVAARGEALFGCPVLNSFGSNETGSLALHRVTDTQGETGVVGRLYPGFAIRFEDDLGREMPAAEGGHIRIRVPESLRVCEYPSLAPVADSDGWVSTGDMGRVGADGLLRLTGRRSELLNLGGDKIAPSRFEAIAEAHPTVRAAAAFRAPNPDGADDVGLAILPGAGFDAEDLGRWMAARVANPYRFHIATHRALPLTSAGKIDRKRLTEDFVAAATQPEPPASRANRQIEETER